MEEKNIQLSNEGSIKEQIADLSEADIQRIIFQSNQWSAFTEQSALMNNIAANIKEIPVLPSEEVKSKETSALIKVEFPETGGILTFMEGYDFPYKGYPFAEFVEKIDFVKKSSRTLLSGAYHRMKLRSKWRFITLIPALWAAKDAVRAGIYTMYRIIERFRMKKERYSDAVREIYRAFSEPIKNETELDAEFRCQIRDLACMILEFDNAYRFRAQDIIAELDKSRLQKDFSGELIRLFELMMAREKRQEVKDTWRLAKYAIRFYLRFDKNMARMIRNILERMDIEKVKLSIEDKVFCIPRVDYSFGFMENPADQELKYIKLAKLKEMYYEEVQKIENESTKEHEMVEQREIKQILDDKYNNLLQEIKEKYEEAKNNLKLQLI